MLLTKAMLGTVFKVRVTPYHYVYQYTNFGTFYTKSLIDAIGQVYDPDTDTMSDLKCFVVANLSDIELQHINNLVAFDAYCIFTHEALTLATHPLDTSARPVMMLSEILNSGIPLTDSRLVSTQMTESGWTNKYYLESKNASDLTEWGSPECRIIWTPEVGDYSPRFNGTERYWGRCPELLDSSLAYLGDDINTHLSTNEVDYSYGFEVRINYRVKHEVALSATADYTAGTRYENHNAAIQLAYHHSAKNLGSIKNDYGYRTSTKSTFASSLYVSSAPNVDANDAGGTINATNVLSSLNDTNGSVQSGQAFSNFSTFSGANTYVYTTSIGNYKQFKFTLVTDSVGLITSMDVEANDTGDTEILGYEAFYTLGHGL